ncbi:MAG TPA: carboxypeptidase regulatory-like domain-containing protein [Pseudonocardiaceae bacterium]|nr:carboxypeptidase regulatory-like domain-containing protein [Pseudonocardiaceae bacterium]
MGPPGPVRRPSRARSEERGLTPWAPGVLRALLITLIASAALLGLATQSLAAQQPPTTASQPTPPEDEGLPVSGTLRNVDGTLIAGVRVQVLDSSGQQIAETTSDANGRWELVVPKPGRYTFRIDQQSLPRGVTVLQGEVVREVAPGTLSLVVFRFGEQREGLQTSATAQVLRVLVDGIRFGLVIGITGVGLSLIFGTTGLTNFAHGELVTIGAVAAWTLNVTFGLQLIWATLLALLIGAALGAANDLGIWRPMRRRRAGLIAQLVISIGLALALRYLVLIYFGGRSEAFADYTNQVEHDYGIISITDKDVATIVISLVVLIGIALLLQRTRIGKAMRAVSDNRDLAAASGIDVERVVLFVWILAGALAALGGVLFGLSELAGTVQYEMGFNLLLLMFAGVILGGLGTAYGALVGCLLVGILVQVSAQIIPVDLKYLGGLAVLIVILVIRPQGLLGSRARIG